MDGVMQEISELIARNVRKRFYCAIHYPLAEQEEMLAAVPHHLRYMEEIEDMVFLSGPFIAEGKVVDMGFTVLRVASEEEAHAILREEPLIKTGLRRYELKFWEVREGTLTLSTKLSATEVALS